VKYRILTSIIILFLSTVRPGWAQFRPDTLRAKPDTAKKVKVYRITPLKYFKEPGFQLISDDSLKRWQLWTNPVEWENRQKGVITHRLGGMGRNSGYLLLDHGNNYRKTYYDGYLMDNPVTGTFNATRLPQHMLYHYFRNTDGIDAIDRIRSEDFYVIKPLTRVDYEQSRFGLRSLDALVTQNIKRKWNVLASYWGKSEDGAYENGKFVGNQAKGRVTYHMNHKMVWETSLLYNGWTLDQSNGYLIPDMYTFNFDRLNTRAKVTGGGLSGGGKPRSKVRSTILKSTLYIRKDTLHRSNLSLSGYYDVYHRSYRSSGDSTLLGNTYQVYPADTSYYKVKKLGVSVRKTISLGPTLLDVSADINRFNVVGKQYLALTKTFWTKYNLSARNEWDIFHAAKLNLRVSHSYRSDGFSSRNADARFDWHVFKGLRIHASLAAGSRMPTIQNLYWNSLSFKGNSRLKKEQIERGEAGVRIRISNNLQLGFTAYDSRYQNPVVLGLNRNFENIGTYQSQGATAWANFDNKSIEIDLSSTFQRFKSTDGRLENRLLNDSGNRMWDRVGIYWKGYALKRATYIKTGFYTIFSPFSYQSGHYYPQLDIWQYMNEDQPIPYFYRVDYDLSARVRWLMIYMRVENLLDGLGQRGYFETADYPMSSRRFRFGIKVIFRN